MAWTDNIFRWLGFGRYNSTPPTLAEGAVEELQLDNRGRLRVAVETANASLQGRYRAAPAPVADGELTDLLVDAQGRLQLALAPAAEPSTRYVSTALEREAAAKVSGGKVREVVVISTSASDLYLMLVDKGAALAGGEQPFFRALVPAGSQVSVAFQAPHSFATGLRVALSTDPVTWADPGVDEGLFYVELD